MFDKKKLTPNLELIYGKEKSQILLARLEEIIKKYQKSIQVGNKRYHLDQKDIVLITYGDQFREEGCKPLEILNRFCTRYIKNDFNTIHILPFFPYSSDDGFSIINYKEVNPLLGDWRDIHAFSENFRLMIDGVFNHISQSSHWFQAYLNNEYPYCDYFITVPIGTDLSKVVRPRTLPLLSTFNSKNGIVNVWTTFSKDQIDLNYAFEDVFLDIVDVMLFYIEKGAKIIRIDAVPFLWKEIGTDCIHRPQTHALVKAFRAILDWVAPEVLIITESNVPFKENLTYLGDHIKDDNGGTDEAQLIYQFSLGPLILHTFLKKNARKIREWISKLPKPYRYFNFIASHDGIGLNPAMGLLDENEIDDLIETTRQHGGKLSYKKDIDGHKSVYELNITLYDFLNDPENPDLIMDIDRFIASQAIMLALAGVPGVYIHSLFGSHNFLENNRSIDQPRSINRAKFSYKEIVDKLADQQSREAIIFRRYQQLLECRKKNSAFTPFAKQEIVEVDDRVLCFYRENTENRECVICLTNVSNETIDINLPLSLINEDATLIDMLSGRVFSKNSNGIFISVQPYQTLWINN